MSGLAAAEGSSSAMPVGGQSDSQSSPTTVSPKLGTEQKPLTSQEVVELKAFSQGKVKIEEHIRRLEAAPRTTPFDGFKSMAASSRSVIEAQDALPFTRRDVEAWQKEREELESEAGAFHTRDMTKLRDMAKESVSRPMSSQDTDLVELALETLYALDKLLILLHTRKVHLDLLAARVEWEEQRAKSWEDYYSLANEVDDVVRNKAQWLRSSLSGGAGASHASQQSSGHATRSSNDSGSHDSAEGASHEDASAGKSESRGLLEPMSSSGILASPSKPGSSHDKRSVTASRAQCEVLQVIISKLRLRITRWSTDKVGLASKAMDRIIDHCKVPDELLDEQDQLENKVEELDGRLKFLLELVEHWKRCDNILATLRDVHKKARRLAEDAVFGGNAGVLSAPDQISLPQRDQVQELKRRASEVESTLASVCGQAALKRYVQDMTASARTLDIAHGALQDPVHQTWPAQADTNKDTRQFLLRELYASAKHVRSAIRGVQKYREAADAMDAFKAQVGVLGSVASELEGLRTTMSDLRGSVVDSVSHAKDTESLDCALSSAQGWGKQADESTYKVSKFSTNVSTAIKELSVRRNACIQAGISKGSLDTIEKALAQEIPSSLQQLSADRGRLSALCKEVLVLSEVLTDSQKISRDLLDVVKVLQDDSVNLGPPSSALEAQRRSEQLTALASLKTYPATLRQARIKVQGEVGEKDLRGASEVLVDFIRKQEALLDKISARLAWEELRVKQGQEVQALDATFDQLLTKGEEFRVHQDEEKKSKEEAGYEHAEQDVAGFKTEVNSFVNSVSNRISIIGQPPSLPVSSDEDAAKIDAQLAFIDDRVRAYVNGRANHLTALIQSLSASTPHDPKQPDSPEQEQRGSSPLDIPSSTRERSRTSGSATSFSSETTGGVGASSPLTRWGADFPKSASTDSFASSGRHEIRTASSSSSVRSSIMRLDGSALPARSEKLSSLLARLNADPMAQLSSRRLPTQAEAASIESENTALESEARTAMADSAMLSSERFSVNKALVDRTGRVRRVRALADFGDSVDKSNDAIEKCRDALDLDDVDNGAITLQEALTVFHQTRQAFGGLQANKIARHLFEDVKLSIQSLEDRIAMLRQLQKEATDGTSQQQRKRRSLIEIPTGNEQEQFVPVRYLRRSVSREGSSVDSRPSTSASTHDSAATDSPETSAMDSSNPIPPPLVVGPETSGLPEPSIEVKSQLPPIETSDTPVIVEHPVSPVRTPVEAEDVFSARASTPLKSPIKSFAPSLRVLGSPADTPVKRRGQDDLGQRTPSGSQVPRFPTSSPRKTLLHARSSSRLSVGSNRSNSSRRSSGVSTSTRRSVSPSPVKKATKPNSYRPKPQHKLDVAVSKIVNRLPVAVSMQMTQNKEKTGSRGKSYSDETGHYLLSDPAEPLQEPKLVFCRILRSRMVMVRIGGGWQELGSFITQRFRGDVDIVARKSSRSVSSVSTVSAGSIDSDAFADISGGSLLLTPNNRSNPRSSFSRFHGSLSPSPSINGRLSPDVPRISTPTPSRHGSISPAHSRLSSSSKIPIPATLTPSKKHQDIH